jgi:maltooligosyltrehalose trehalohydrolase
MLFQGQEFAASSPFLYFTDHNPDLGKLVTEGRRSEFKGFSAFRDPATRDRIPDPQAASTFERSRVDLAERERNAEVYDCYRQLLRLRRTDPVFSRADRRSTLARAVGPQLLTIHRWHGQDHRLVLLNFGGEEALVEPTALGGLPEDARWRPLWSVGDEAIGRCEWEPEGWRILARSGVALATG